VSVPAFTTETESFVNWLPVPPVTTGVSGFVSVGENGALATYAGATVFVLGGDFTADAIFYGLIYDADTFTLILDADTYSIIV